MATPTLALKVISISTSLIAAGGIATLTLFSIPSLRALPASRSLPQIRWLFSRGSHIFPAASLISSSGFLSLAFLALPVGQRTLPHLLKTFGSRGGAWNGSVAGYVASAVLCISIAPWTAQIMVPTNFELIRIGHEKGGKRSERSAKEEANKDSGGTEAGGSDPALDSVDGQGQASQFTDLSDPQGKIEASTTEEEDRKVQQLLTKFGQLNMGRAVLMGAGGILGLVTSLA